MRGLCFVVLLLASTGLRAADWPMGGRTPHRNPVSPEKNLPSEWLIPTEEHKAKNIKWKVELEATRTGGGPVVAGGYVWIGTNNNDDRDDKLPDLTVLRCFRESDGKAMVRLDSQRLPGFPEDWPKQSLTGSPSIEGNHLWFINNRKEVTCLNLNSLHKGRGGVSSEWVLDMVADLGVYPRAIMIPGCDSHGSPVAYKDLLFLPTGNGVRDDCVTVPAPEAPSLICLRKDTGRVVWTDNSPGKAIQYGHFSSPTVFEIGGRGIVVMPEADGWVRAFEAETGRPVWQFDVNPKKGGEWSLSYEPGSKLLVHSPPVFDGLRLYFSTGNHPEANSGDDGTLFCIDPSRRGDISPEVLDAQGRAKTNPESGVIWRYSPRDIPAPKNPDGTSVKGPDGRRIKESTIGMHRTITSVAVADGLVIANDGSGIVHCIEAATGKARWTYDARATPCAHPLVADGKIYIGLDSGEVLVLALDRSLKVIARMEFEASIRAPIVAANGTLYVLTERDLWAIAKDVPSDPNNHLDLKGKIKAILPSGEK